MITTFWLFSLSFLHWMKKVGVSIVILSLVNSCETSEFYEDFHLINSPRILYSRQRDRLKAEEQAREHCRRLKRTSEVTFKKQFFDLERGKTLSPFTVFWCLKFFFLFVRNLILQKKFWKLLGDNKYAFKVVFSGIFFLIILKDRGSVIIGHEGILRQQSRIQPK